MLEQFLKPCPFCGHQPEICVLTVNDSEFYRVECTSCEMEIMTAPADSAKKAVWEWNKYAGHIRKPSEDE